MKFDKVEFFANKEEYLAYKAAWKSYFKTGKATSVDFLVHNMIMGRDFHRGFTKITNANKLANGSTPFQAIRVAIGYLRSWDYYCGLIKGKIAPPPAYELLKTKLVDAKMSLRQEYDIPPWSF